MSLCSITFGAGSGGATLTVLMVGSNREMGRQKKTSAGHLLIDEWIVEL